VKRRLISLFFFSPFSGAKSVRRGGEEDDEGSECWPQLQGIYWDLFLSSLSLFD
jgi:hypothetical protein